MEYDHTEAGEQLQDYRINNFDVKVEPCQIADPLWSEEFSLCVTHNNRQWSHLNLLPHEAQRIINTLQEYLKEN